MQKKSKIQVIERTEKQVLFECEYEQSELAYAFAQEMEELGVDVIVKTPTVVASLSECLGANDEEQKALEDEMIAEIESHGVDSCCAEDTDDDSKKHYH